MPDIVSELQQAIARAVQVQVDEMAAQRGWDDRPTALLGGNALGATPTPMDDFIFTSGYDGSITTTAFMFDLSPLDGSDFLI